MTYRISFILEDDGISRFLNAVTPWLGVLAIEHTSPSGETWSVTPTSQVTPRPPARRTRAKPVRRVRGSKVADAILKALEGGQPVSRADLKRAVVDANLAASSLPGSLILMAKEGKIQRVGEGLYSLPQTEEQLPKAAE